VLVSSTIIKDSVAAAGTALLLGVAAMSLSQDPVAASAPLGAGPASHADRLAQGDPRTIEVVAKRFTFEPSRIEVTEGEHVRLVVKSADGVHGVEIKKFKVLKKVPRGGEAVTIDFVASSAGEYPILCSEYCGKDHDSMTGTLVVRAR
jgi:cytochrome c oxidase subunit 2